MAPPQGLIYWQGINDLVSGQMTFAPGVSPSICKLRIPPQDARTLRQAGPLVFRYGPRTWTLQNCRLDSITATTGSSGEQLWELIILDRRWVWQECGQISGFYNARVGGKLAKQTMKSPQELAILCLKAMRETRYDVSALPDKARPEVDWEYTLPAEALAQLCDSLGCMIALGLDDRVRIVKKGFGALLPTANVIDGSAISDPPDPPGRIVVVGARTRWQEDFEVEPVGLEPDGSIAPIDELSYCPEVNGVKTWKYFNLHDFTGLDKPECRGVAQKSVFRWYRIKTPFTLPKIADPIKDLGLILPLESEQIQHWDRDGVTQAKPPYVFGKYWLGAEGSGDVVDKIEPDIPNAPEGLYTKGFNLDMERAIVQFSEPVLRHKTDKSVQAGFVQVPADLRLRVAVNLRHEGSLAWERKEYGRAPSTRSPVPGSKRYIVREDVVREIFVQHLFMGDFMMDNKEEAEEAAEHYLDAAMLEYEPRQSASISYVGFQPIQPDGAIRQVSWVVSPDGTASTRASRNREEADIAPTHQESRFLERLHEELADKAKPERQRAEDSRKRKAPR